MSLYFVNDSVKQVKPVQSPQQQGEESASGSMPDPEVNEVDELDQPFDENEIATEDEDGTLAEVEESEIPYVAQPDPEQRQTKSPGKKLNPGNE